MRRSSIVRFRDQLRLWSLIQKQPGRTRPWYFEQFGGDERAFYREVEVLVKAGIVEICDSQETKTLRVTKRVVAAKM